MELNFDSQSWDSILLHNNDKHKRTVELWYCFSVFQLALFTTILHSLQVTIPLKPFHFDVISIEIILSIFCPKENNLNLSNSPCDIALYTN